MEVDQEAWQLKDERSGDIGFGSAVGERGCWKNAFEGCSLHIEINKFYIIDKRDIFEHDYASGWISWTNSIFEEE